MWKIVLRITLGLAADHRRRPRLRIVSLAVQTNQMHARLDAGRLPVGPKVYHASELIGLPAPVQRYFRAAPD